MTSSTPLDAGHAALRRAEWETARAAFIVASLETYGTETLGPPPAL